MLAVVATGSPLTRTRATVSNPSKTSWTRSSGCGAAVKLVS